MAHATDAATRSKGYRIDFERLKENQDDKWIKRGRLGRWLCFIVCVILMFAVPTWFCWFWASFIGFPIIGGLVGFAIGGWIAHELVPDRFLINNAELGAYVTENLFGGEMVAYGPGAHPCYPQEQRNKKGNYSLEVLTLSFQVKISTETSQVLIDCEYEYAVSLRNITRAIALDISTVERGLVAFMANFLTSKCAGKNAEWVRGHIDDLNKELSGEFVGHAESFASRYGLLTATLVISKISFPESVQQTRDAIDKAANMHTVVAKLYGITPEDLAGRLAKKEISIADYNKMLNRAIVESGNAKMTFNVLEADIPALVGKLAEKFTKGGA